MNISHYPSLELCKKLTEAGFPETELWIFDTRKSWKSHNCPYINEYDERKFIPFWNIEIGDWELEITNFKDNPSEWYNESSPLVCPSVMELLDRIKLNEKYTIDIDKNWEVYSVMIFANKIDELTKNCPIFSWTLPNALAEMWLWLKENNYLPDESTN